MEPKYQKGDRVGGWEILRVHKYDWYDAWIYNLERNTARGKINLTCEETNLEKIFPPIKTRLMRLP